MAAGIGDLFTKAGNGTRPVPTTLNAILASGASPGTANCAALTGWNNATAIHFVIYTIDTNGKKVAGSQTDWKGIVSGTTITGLVLKAGTNNGYSVGAIVEAAPTAAWADDLGTGLLVEHKQTGAHAAVTTDSITNAGLLTNTGSIALAGKLLGSDGVTPIVPSQFSYAISGGLWSLVSGFNGTMTAFKGVINNKFVSVAAIASRTFTASKDTYIYIKDDGTVSYNEVTNNTASPAAPLNSDGTAQYLLGIIQSSGAALTVFNQGSIAATGPTVSSQTLAVADSIGNLIYNNTPNPSLIGYAVGTGTLTNSAGGDITGASITVIVPTGRRIELVARMPFTGQGATNLTAANILEGATGIISPGSVATNSTTAQTYAHSQGIVSPTAGVHTYKVNAVASTATTNVPTGTIIYARLA